METWEKWKLTQAKFKLETPISTVNIVLTKQTDLQTISLIFLPLKLCFGALKPKPTLTVTVLSVV